jgi:glycosyltransferase involved in cell wall biosynthesis
MVDGSAPAGISVIIPCFNAEATLGRQLGALAAQDWDGPWEVVVADNGSDDGSADVARSWADRLPIRVVDASDRRGASHARNVGAAAARHPSLVWVDADDRVTEGWLRRMAEASQGADVFCSSYVHDATTLGSEARSSGAPRSGGLAGRLSDRGFLDAVGGCEGIGVSRAVFEEAGGFIEDMLWGSEDTAFCWTIQLAGHELRRVAGAGIEVSGRATTMGLVRQQIAWGIGSVDLYRRFRDRGAPRSNTVGALARWVVLVGSSPVALLRPGYRWRWLGTLARRWGRVRGSVRFRVLFL